MRRDREGQRKRPYLLEKDGAKLASEIFGSDAQLKPLACKDALLGVLEVVPDLAADQALHPARRHLALHHR